MIGWTNLWIDGRNVVLPELNRRRALLVLVKIDEILAWEQTKEHERDERFVELGQHLCEVRQVGLINRLGPPRNVIGDLDVVSRGKSGQQVEFLKDEADFGSPHFGSLGIVKRGKVDPADFDFARTGASKAPKQVKQRGFAATGRAYYADELPRLYSEALAFVYPTHYEGFGLPVLEAMQCGCPVVTSGDPAVVELSGGAAIHATSVEEIAESMRAVASRPEVRVSLRSAGLRRAARYSWDRTARLTHAIYASALGDER